MANGNLTCRNSKWSPQHIGADIWRASLLGHRSTHEAMICPLQTANMHAGHVATRVPTAIFDARAASSILCCGPVHHPWLEPKLVGSVVQRTLQLDA